MHQSGETTLHARVLLVQHQFVIRHDDKAEERMEVHGALIKVSGRKLRSTWVRDILQVLGNDSLVRDLGAHDPARRH